MKFYKRGFLNKREGTASFEYDVNNERYDTRAINADFTIRDCNRSITLDFYCWNIDEIDEKLAKIDRLIKALQDFKQCVLVIDEYNKTRKEGDENE